MALKLEEHDAREPSTSSSSMDAMTMDTSSSNIPDIHQEYEEEIEETSPSGRRWVANVVSRQRIVLPQVSLELTLFDL